MMSSVRLVLTKAYVLGTVLSDMSRALVSRDVSDLYTLSLSHFIGSQDPCPLLPVNIYINI